MILKFDWEAIFPVDDDRGRRQRVELLKLLASHNDITAVLKVLTAPTANETEDDEAIEHSERLYFIRLCCAHLHEAMESFGKCRQLIDEYGQFDNDSSSLRNKIDAAMSDPVLVAYIKKLRDRTFHYDCRGNPRKEGRVVFVDESVNGCRFLVAEDGFWNAVGDNLTKNEVNAMHEKVLALIRDLLQFINHVFATVYEKHQVAFSLVNDSN